MSEEQPKRNRIGLATIIFMPVVALFFDLLSLLIPGAGAMGWIVIGIWLLLLGVSPFTIKRLATAGVSALVEIIPILSVLPSVTVGVIVIIGMVKSEDKLGIKLPLVK